MNHKVRPFIYTRIAFQIVAVFLVSLVSVCTRKWMLIMPSAIILNTEEGRGQWHTGGAKKESRKRKSTDETIAPCSPKRPRATGFTREVTASPHSQYSHEAVLVSHEPSPRYSPVHCSPTGDLSTKEAQTQPEVPVVVRPPLQLLPPSSRKSQNSRLDDPPIIPNKVPSIRESSNEIITAEKLHNPLQSLCHSSNLAREAPASTLLFSNRDPCAYSDICVVILVIFVSLPILFPIEQTTTLPEETITSNLERNKAIFGTLGVWLLFVQLHYVFHIARNYSSSLRATLPLRLKHFAQRCRTNLKSFVEFSSLTVNQDKVLRFLQFGIWFVAKLYAPNSEGREALKVVSIEIGLARYVTRFLGWPSALEALWNGTWTNKDSSTYPRWSLFFGDLTALGMLIYFPNEHVAFLHVKAPQWVKATSGSAELWCAWSARGWVASIATDIAQGIISWNDALHKQQLGTSTNASQENETNTLKNIQQAKFQILANALILLPALREGLAPEWKEFGVWFTEDMANFLQLIEAIVVLYEATV